MNHKTNPPEGPIDLMELAVERLLHSCTFKVKDVKHPYFDFETNKLKLPTRTPKEVYLLSGLSCQEEGRYTVHPEELMRPVADILGEVAEVALADPNSGTYQWYGVERVSRPKGILPVFGRKVAHWYAVHIRNASTDKSYYYKELVGLDEKSRNVPFNYEGRKAVLYDQCRKGPDDPFSFFDKFVSQAAFIEDQYRVNTFLVSMTDEESGLNMKFAVEEREVQSLLRLRDGPLLSGGRRKAILHWVSQHLRRLPQWDSYTSVCEHLRGITECAMGGFKFVITPNAHDAGVKKIVQQMYAPVGWEQERKPIRIAAPKQTPKQTPKQAPKPSLAWEPTLAAFQARIAAKTNRDLVGSTR